MGSIENIAGSEAIEVIEGLLQLCANREKEIAELTFELEKLKLNQKKQPVKKPESAGIDVGQLARCDIIVADGIASQRKSLITILSQEGFEVVGSAESGWDAVELFKEKKPALIMIDAHIPDLDGVQATKQIKEFDSEAKIIIISRNRDRKMVLEAVNAGASDYICKPYEPHRLIDSAKRLLAG